MEARFASHMPSDRQRQRGNGYFFCSGWVSCSASFWELLFTGFFAMFPVLGKKAVLEWFLKEGLIGSSYVCPKCGKSMELKERTGKKVNDRL
ncbi:hypothetical protein TNCV_3364341 [Trichonephila clavipes]|nr:hypothetical protein TNCV_3364341 [Trichonephila clavipes]